VGSFLSEEFKVKNKQYKDRFQKEFRPVFEDDINGSFHCEYGFADSTVKPAGSRVILPQNYWKSDLTSS
jgi:hypothetical protein